MAAANAVQVFAVQDYNIKELLGEGAYGQVSRAVLKTDSSVEIVIKEVLLRDLTEDEKNFAVKEALILKKLSHPNVIKYIGCESDGNILRIGLELCQDDLGKAIEKNKSMKPMVYFAESVIMKMLIDSSLGLRYLHDNNLIHRDVKPGNLLRTITGDIKVADLGLARELSSVNSRAKTYCGTPAFLAPEIIRKQGYGIKVDAWSLGVSVFQLASLFLPFDASGLDELYGKIVNGDRRRLPKLFEYGVIGQVVDLLLKSDPAMRLTVSQLLRRPELKPSVKAWEDAKGLKILYPAASPLPNRGACANNINEEHANLPRNDPVDAEYFAKPKKAFNWKGVDNAAQVQGAAGLQAEGEDPRLEREVLEEAEEHLVGEDLKFIEEMDLNDEQEPLAVQDELAGEHLKLEAYAGIDDQELARQGDVIEHRNLDLPGAEAEIIEPVEGIRGDANQDLPAADVGNMEQDDAILANDQDLDLPAADVAINDPVQQHLNGVNAGLNQPNNVLVAPVLKRKLNLPENDYKEAKRGKQEQKIGSDHENTQPEVTVDDKLLEAVEMLIGELVPQLKEDLRKEFKRILTEENKPPLFTVDQLNALKEILNAMHELSLPKKPNVYGKAVCAFYSKEIKDKVSRRLNGRITAPKVQEILQLMGKKLKEDQTNITEFMSSMKDDPGVKATLQRCGFIPTG